MKINNLRQYLGCCDFIKGFCIYRWAKISLASLHENKLFNVFAKKHRITFSLKNHFSRCFLSHYYFWIAFDELERAKLYY